MLFEELETKRMYLKNISLEDTDFIYKQFSNKTVSEYLYDAEPVKTKEEALDIINFYIIPESRYQHRWILVRKIDGAKMGTCGFHCYNQELNSIEIGYDLYPDYWGNGYMQEAINTILEFAKDKLSISRVDAHIYAENVRSVALASKLGFHFNGETINYNFRGIDYIHNIYTIKY